MPNDGNASTIHTITCNLSSKNTLEDLSTAVAFSLQLEDALQQQKREIYYVLEVQILAPSVETSQKEFNF